VVVRQREGSGKEVKRGCERVVGEVGRMDTTVFERGKLRCQKYRDIQISVIFLWSKIYVHLKEFSNFAVSVPSTMVGLHRHRCYHL
jgi:hypothetical protein